MCISILYLSLTSLELNMKLLPLVIFQSANVFRNLNILSEVVVSPPFVFLPTVQSLLKADFQVAAQNCWVKKGGAFTGEVR